MNIAVYIHDGPLADPPTDWPDPTLAGAAGAIVCFDGIVRADEDGQPITALDYEVYEPMATRELQHLADDVSRSFGLLALCAEHSRGRVPAGQCSFRLRVAAAHRAAALHAVEVFIDKLKQDVPIWKTAIAAGTNTSTESDRP